MSAHGTTVDSIVSATGPSGLPVVRTLAREQFDDYVKRVRIFAHPRIVADLRDLSGISRLIEQAIDRTEGRP